MTTWWWWGEPRASSTVRWLFLVRGTTSALDWWCSPFSCRATQSVPSLRASLPFYRATDVSSRCLAPFNPGDSFVILCGACLWMCSAARAFGVANVRWLVDFTWRWRLHELPRGANRLGVSRSAAWTLRTGTSRDMLIGVVCVCIVVVGKSHFICHFTPSFCGSDAFWVVCVLWVHTVSDMIFYVRYEFLVKNK